MGEFEQQEVTTNLQHTPSFLERLRGIKTWIYSGFREYMRTQINTETRRQFNHKFVRAMPRAAHH